MMERSLLVDTIGCYTIGCYTIGCQLVLIDIMETSETTLGIHDMGMQC